MSLLLLLFKKSNKWMEKGMGGGVPACCYGCFPAVHKGFFLYFLTVFSMSPLREFLGWKKLHWFKEKNKKKWLKGGREREGNCEYYTRKRTWSVLSDAIVRRRQVLEIREFEKKKTIYDRTDPFCRHCVTSCVIISQSKSPFVWAGPALVGDLSHCC